MKTKIRELIAKIILIDDYNDGKGTIYPARECQQRAAVHFLWPFSFIGSASHFGGFNCGFVFAVLWVVFVIQKEVRESQWQLTKKTVSDVLTKLAGLLGLILC